MYEKWIYGIGWHLLQTILSILFRFFSKTKPFPFKTIYPTPDRSVECVMWCRSQLLSTGLDGYIVLYDLARLTAKKLVPSIGGAIWCISKNRAETKIVVGTEDGYVVLYEMQMDGILFEKTLNKQDCKALWHFLFGYFISSGKILDFFKTLSCFFIFIFLCKEKYSNST